MIVKDERIFQARRAACRNALTDGGVSVDQAERWCDAWELDAALQGIGQSAEYWGVPTQPGPSADPRRTRAGAAPLSGSLRSARNGAMWVMDEDIRGLFPWLLLAVGFFAGWWAKVSDLQAAAERLHWIIRLLDDSHMSYHGSSGSFFRNEPKTEVESTLSEASGHVHQAVKLLDLGRAPLL